MKKMIIVSALAIASTLGVSAVLAQPGGTAQDRAGGPAMPGPGMMGGGSMPGMMQGTMWQGGMRGAMGMMGAGMMGQGMMGGGMARMMVVMMDANGDGAVSLDEFQAVHARMFKAMDTDSDGKLSADEVASFCSGTGSGSAK